MDDEFSLFWDEDSSVKGMPLGRLLINTSSNIAMLNDTVASGLPGHFSILRLGELILPRGPFYKNCDISSLFIPMSLIYAVLLRSAVPLASLIVLNWNFMWSYSHIFKLKKLAYESLLITSVRHEFKTWHELITLVDFSPFTIMLHAYRRLQRGNKVIL